MLCNKYGCDFQLDKDGQVSCIKCGAMDDDKEPSVSQPADIFETQRDFE